MPIPLTTRQVRTAEWLLGQTGPRSVSEAAQELRLSPRVVRTTLDVVERFLAEFDVAVHRQRGVGVWVDGAPSARTAARTAVSGMSDEDSIRVLSAADRVRLVLFEMLAAAPESRTVEQLQTTLEVSVTSARRDLSHADDWLTDQGLFLARQPGRGVTVVGTETGIRRALVKLLLEIVPVRILADDHIAEEWWRVSEIAAGLRDAVRALPLDECHELVLRNEALREQLRMGHPWLAIDLAVLAFRARMGKGLDLEPGALRSLVDHPVWATGSAIGEDMAAIVGAQLDDAEVGGITEHLLGMVELSEPTNTTAERGSSLVRDAVSIAAHRLHPGLADDAELARSLEDHLERLRIRVRYGLPVHNPLLREVAERYPDVHAVAVEIAAILAEDLAGPISDDEAGFVTMYLSGALERLRLKPRKRAVVVCPSGVATAWILVSRIQAEFPELDIVEVVSAGTFEHSRDLEADIVISTVDIPNGVSELPIVVVNALLPSEDVRRLARTL